MVTKNRPTLLLITNSTYYPIFFRHYLPNYYTTTSSSNFQMEELERIKPDCIILDDQLFKGGVVALCDSLHKRKAFAHTPILIITAKLKKAYFQQLTNAGANGFIREPLEEGDVIERIQEAERLHLTDQKLESLADTALQTVQEGGDMRLKPLFNKAELEPFEATVKRGHPIALLAIAVEYSERHEFTEKQITDVLHRVVKTDDLLLPLGQGKYALLLNLISKEDALFVGETIRDVITHALHIGIKIGIASQKKPPYANIHDMIRDAKTALLSAQTKGTSIEVA